MSQNLPPICPVAKFTAIVTLIHLVLATAKVRRRIAPTHRVPLDDTCWVGRKSLMAIHCNQDANHRDHQSCQTVYCSAA